MKNIYLLIFLLLFLSGCKKESCYDCNDTHTYFDLTQEQIAKTPYFTNPDFDTLTYISNKGDTLIFVKLNTQSSYYRTINSNCPDCPVHYSYYQELHNTYKTIKGNGKFEVRHILKDYSTNDAVLVNFNDFIFGYHDRHIGSKTFINYLGDVNINNKIYTKSLFSGHLGDTSIAISYINLTYGAFYYNLKDINTSFLLYK